MWRLNFWDDMDHLWICCGRSLEMRWLIFGEEVGDLWICGGRSFGMWWLIFGDEVADLWAWGAQSLGTCGGWYLDMWRLMFGILLANQWICGGSSMWWLISGYVVAHLCGGEKVRFKVKYQVWRKNLSEDQKETMEKRNSPRLTQTNLFFLYIVQHTRKYFLKIWYLCFFVIRTHSRSLSKGLKHFWFCC